MTTEEYEEFYASSVRRLTGQVYLLTGDLQEAEDVVQEAFVRCWTRRASIDKTATPEAWVRTVAFRLAVSRFRSTRRGREAWRREVRSRPAEVAGPDEQSFALAQALGQLPPRQRLVMVSFYLCDMTVEQIAAAAHMSSGTVKTHLFRGRAAMALLLDDTEEDERDGA
ncbi:SigE family RNA polymerase sigma factor [Streptomyces sp. S3(2020)]|uniref:SigE family RNA polymerase sigma factor n=1 Tax=Streptomyces sp. S3(2020) TaxID=2732044 RepID=UPI001489530E|nr:SigE family RNA polymerase sigma factor [Streptomyces sp. S3(2020)]NNN29694.1 SigE family RNA polymerase sigma factor [Streptomyces sp. S3(2020)]